MAKNRILIVEDEEAIARMIAMNLKVANYDTQIYFDGTQTAKALEQDHNYDLALLDVMIPGIDGFQLLEVMKQYKIPVIFLTAKDDLNSKIQGLKGGAEDYIVKPFEILELLVRMEKVLERADKVNHVLQILDMEINFAEHTVRQKGQEIALKPMEFELLAVLAKNKNIAISREKLLKMVWGIDYQGETRTVDVHIGQLRKKLGLGNHIKTISKLGYRLEE
ncbi:MAG: response regulator transcription factor [Lachnospiraceae bacterium]|nr:response regulator transcription factor [Robinsoniella sp.]MDY3766966.1 response regulator transcription factor [Lachnospiraceae bacterium]